MVAFCGHSGLERVNFGDAIRNSVLRVMEFVMSRAALAEYDLRNDVPVKRRSGRQFDLTLYGRVVRGLYDASGDYPLVFIPSRAVRWVRCQVLPVAKLFVAYQHMSVSATVRFRAVEIVPAVNRYSVECFVCLVWVYLAVPCGGRVTYNDGIAVSVGVIEICDQRAVCRRFVTVGF